MLMQGKSAGEYTGFICIPFLFLQLFCKFQIMYFKIEFKKLARNELAAVIFRKGRRMPTLDPGHRTMLQVLQCLGTTY